MAKQNPNSLVIGIDPCHENLVEISSKVLKKPSKGGLSNVLFVLASAENMPYELNNLADHVYINFPWGSLLQGIVLVQETIWNNIRQITKHNAHVEVIFGYDEKYEQKEIVRLGLPRLDQSYLSDFIIPKLELLGFRIQSLKILTLKELQSYPTTWAKKLSYGQERQYYQMILKVIGKAPLK